MKILRSAKWINFFLGICNIYLLLYKGQLIYFVVIFVLNMIFFYIQTRSYFYLIVAILTYPFGLLLSKFKGTLKEDIVIEKKEIEEEEINVDIMPLKSYILLGTPDEKKRAIIEYTKAVKAHKRPASEAVLILKKLVNDEHPDVGLYASEAIEEIENFLIDELFKANDDKEFCKIALEYVKSGYVYGSLEEYYKNLIKSYVENISKSDPDYYIIKFEVTGDIEILYKGFEETGSEKIKELLIFEEFKRKNIKAVKKLLL
ncbi:MAG: hypothetical protein J7J14_06830 [Thermotogaceae bacterium]|nr:hypothetical protein [Thermotogaceae bacterium]RKX40896.1 MAG: hypothetical protein DRP23_01990 [Thermotogota bacterium]